MAIKQRNLLVNILFWITMIFLAYFAENVVLFDLSNFQRGFTLIEYVLLFSGIIAILGYYFHCEYKYNGIRPKWIVVVVLFLIVVSAAIGIFSTPDIQYFETLEVIDEVETVVIREYTITLIGKIKSLLYVIIAAAGVYIQFVVLPRLVSFKKYVLFLMYIIVIVALISAFVSYFLDFDSYVHLYYHGLYGYDFPQSFVFNRNMYALMLLLGMLALYVIISYLPKWYNYVFLIFLFVNIFFTFSKAALGVALITFIVHFIYRMIVTFKQSKIRNIIYLVLVGILAIAGTLLIPFPVFMDIQLFNEARRFILEYYVELGIGSYESRAKIWESVLQLSTGIHLWFGRGLHLFNQTLGFYHSGVESSGGVTNYFSHNGFLEILGQWGLVGLIPYCLGILAIFIIDIYVAIKNYKVGIPALIIFGAFLGYTMVETSTLFDLTIEGVTTTSLVALPALSWLYARRHPEKNQEIVKSAEEIEYEMPRYDTAKFERQAAKYIALLLGVTTLFAFYSFYINKLEVPIYILFVTLMLVIFITLPRTLANAYQLRHKKRGAIFGLLFSLSVIIGLAALLLYIFTTSPLVVIFAVKILLINLLLSEKFFRTEEDSFKFYLTNVIGRSSILLFAVIISGSLIVFLYRGLTWFILSEIVGLFIVFTIPFIREFDLKKSPINKKMLLLFGRSIGK
jgi:hypothetical protein